MTETQYFQNLILEAKKKWQELSSDQFDNPIDFVFKKATLESEVQAYQNSMVEYTKLVKDSSEEEAAIIMHKFCKNLSDDHRIELGKVEKFENQEDEKITYDRGRLNGLIDGYNTVRLYFDSLTSQHAAKREKQSQSNRR